MTDAPRAAGTEWEEAYLDERRSPAQRRQTVASLHFPSHGRALDLGCGDGCNLSLLRDLGLTTVACDHSRFLLGHADGKRVQSRGEQLPFAAGTFSAILIDSVLHHLDWRLTLGEARRLLASDGVVAIIEPRPTAARRLLDLTTLSPVARLFPRLHRRSATLRGEWAEYQGWLADYPDFLVTLRRDWRIGELREELMRTVAILQ